MENGGGEGGEETSPSNSRGRPLSPKVPGRLGGSRKRLYWVRKREAQLKGGSNPIKRRSNQVPQDSKIQGEERVKGDQTGDKSKSEPAPATQDLVPALEDRI